MKREARVCALSLLVFTLMLSGCGKKPASLADFFSDVSGSSDWTPSGKVIIFDRENIFDLVNGQAEAFFAYGFEQAAVRDFESAEGAALRIEIWQLATPTDAYGLFTVSIAGTPADVGNDGDSDPGRRLSFWQDRYYVHVRARQEPGDADGSTELAKVLRGFAEEVSAALPSGGERPALMGHLPSDGLAERSERFFHEEISIQNELWLGGKNLLGLGPETDGVLARYELGGGAARLLLIQYPNAEAASAGLAALEAGQADGLVTTDARDDLLGAVFGEIDQTVANELLAEALR